MTLPYLHRIRQIANHVLAVPERFTPEDVFSACAVEFRAVPCTNPHAREFVAYPDSGPFSAIVFRGPQTPANGAPAVVIMHVAMGIRITHTDMSRTFALPMESARVDPRMPPEGTVSFTPQQGARTLRIRFDARSQLLRDISVHVNRPPVPHPGSDRLE